MTLEMAPFFVDAEGAAKKTLYHSDLSRHRNLMVKFKQKPFQSQYPRDGTPGKVVYLELDDGHDYLYTIESDAIAGQLQNDVETESWVKVSASGKGSTATLEVYPMAPFEVAEEAPPQHAAPEPPSPTAVAPRVDTPPTAVNEKQPTQTHVEAVAMTLEVVCAFEGTSVVLDAGAVSRIYNTHFIALSRTRGGLVR
tara:strand:- start:3516 stop:4103 length:588 start_codon:yes stop_codon:yes gene_type:complete